MGQHPAADFVVCVVSLHEQALGANNFLNQARTSAALVRGYQLLDRLPRDYTNFVMLPFDAVAAREFDGLLAQRLRVGPMDLRIAAIALSRGSTVLTRNLRDFRRVPNLNAEDWTV
jgi:tRNA(fMet)-specific endonuclease VapC